MDKIIYNEQWLQIDGYGNYYVSNFGRVKNINTERILKQSKNKNGYCLIVLYKDGKTKCFKIHRLVAFAFLENPNDYKTVDHIDHIPSNNEATNLRFATRSQQNQNRRSYNSSSKYKGVYKNKNKWQAQICVNGNKMSLGTFENEIDAAHAYDTAAKEHFKDFAYLNF